MKNLTREERETVLDNVDAFGNETIISTNEAEDCWLVCSASPKWNRQLERIGAEKLRESADCTHWRLQISMVSLHRLTPRSEAQLAALAEARKKSPIGN